MGQFAQYYTLKEWRKKYINSSGHIVQIPNEDLEKITLYLCKGIQFTQGPWSHDMALSYHKLFNTIEGKRMFGSVGLT